MESSFSFSSIFETAPLGGGNLEEKREQDLIDLYLGGVYDTYKDEEYFVSPPSTCTGPVAPYTAPLAPCTIPLTPCEIPSDPFSFQSDSDSLDSFGIPADLNFCTIPSKDTFDKIPLNLFAVTSNLFASPEPYAPLTPTIPPNPFPICFTPTATATSDSCGLSSEEPWEFFAAPGSCTSPPVTCSISIAPPLTPPPLPPPPPPVVVVVSVPTTAENPSSVDLLQTEDSQSEPEPGPSSKRKRKRTYPGPGLVCKHCGRYLRDEYTMRIHLAKVHTLQVYSRQLPPDTTANQLKTALEKTIQRLGNTTNCSLCNKRTTQKEPMRSHILYKHFDEVISTIRGIQLEETVEEELNPAPPVLSNPIVEASALDVVSALDCPICSQGFYNSSLLEKHVAQHKEKLFNCQYCDQSFSSKDTLRSHSMILHTFEYFQEKIPPGTSKDGLEETINDLLSKSKYKKASNVKRAYGCPGENCTLKCRNLYVLRRHLLQVHFQLVLSNLPPPVPESPKEEPEPKEEAEVPDFQLDFDFPMEGN